ncbi:MULTISPECIES: hypothetical protein [Streptomyces]|uniref:hypothetical protein n=1 Tax=Streptomyces TaxID=1883 RepID=UPI0004BD80FB|nr:MULTISPECIES: hypothetical protein [Streptomyces]KOG84474.1 hypothetical protein ADK33_03475 [Streptomyces griseus subsp. rhodochrous]
MKGFLRAVAGRCDTHDKASPAKIARLEQELGLPESARPASFVEAYTDPDLIDCGSERCRTRRKGEQR